MLESNEVVVSSKSRITSIGTYVPEKVLRNEDLEQMVDTSAEWIEKRTGIQERRIAADDEYTSHLCVKAAEDLKVRYGKDLGDTDLIIVCTSTPDHMFPSVASQVQEQLNIKNCGAIDLGAACAGFTYGLHVANGLISAGLHNKILVIGAETFSKVVDYEDRTTCILFGDGAGAVLVERDVNKPSFIEFNLGSEGVGGKHLYISNLADRIADHVINTNGKVTQNGREVYRWAVKTVAEGIQQLLNKRGCNIDKIDWIVPHSANLRILESISEKMNAPMEKMLYSLEYYGNTSAASIPLSLDVALKEEKLKNGDVIILYGFGGGLVHAGLLMKWNVD